MPGKKTEKALFSFKLENYKILRKQMCFINY